MSQTLPLMATAKKRLNELLKKETILPNQCYGEGDILDVFASAAYVDCTKRTIYSAKARGELKPVPVKSHSACCRIDRIRGYKLEQLWVMRQRRQQDNGDGTYSTKEGKRIPLLKVADARTWRSKASETSEKSETPETPQTDSSWNLGSGVSDCACANAFCFSRGDEMDHSRK